MRARLLCAALMINLLAACGTFGGYGDAGGTDSRFISLRNSETGEVINVTYAANGRYDSAAMAQINGIFRDRVNGEVGKIDPKLIDFMVEIRRRLAVPPDVTIDVISGYRSPARNAALATKDSSVARNSWHTKGKAVDMRIPHINAKAIAEIAKTMQRGGVSHYPRSNHVHVDIGGVRSWNGE